MVKGRNQLGGLGVALLMFAGGLAGCSSPAANDASLRKDDLHGLSTVTGAPTPFDPSHPAARIDGGPVMWDELRPLLAEASGAMILREVALDRAVKEECQNKMIRVDAVAIEAERDLLLSSIERDAVAPGAESGVLLESVRRGRGLGEARFGRLLERNARLRALIRNSVEVAPSDVEEAMLIRYGERYRVRVIVMATEREAAQLKQELEKDPANLDVAFARAAAIKSTDASAVRGGLLEPISAIDQAYPASMRIVLPGLQRGRVSPVVAVEKGAAILLLDSKVEAQIPPEDAGEKARAEVRLRKERIAMEEEARRLLARSEIVVLDPALNWSWRAAAPK